MSEVSAVQDTVKEVTRLNKWLLALFVVLLLFLLVESVLILRALDNQDKATPVFDYPAQQVESRINGVDGPAVRIPSDGSEFNVVVIAEKCNNTDQEIAVQTRVSWDTLDPRGTLIEDWNGVGIVEPGCQQYTFRNPVPELVVDRTLQLIDDFPTLNCVTWAIVGVDSPLSPKQSPERWFTEPFCIYPPLEDEQA